ncbi:MAG: XdhC family protein [Pseudomonadota bacterium]
MALAPDRTSAHFGRLMTLQSQNLLTSQDPIQALLDTPADAALTVIAGVEGPSYRPVGAMMTVSQNGERTGTLSSGCIESDISLHAQDVLRSDVPKVLRYGRGSPFVDIQLPCGGGLDILIVPRPDRAILAEVLKNREGRTPCTLTIDLKTAAMAVQREGQTQRVDDILSIRFEPEIKFLVFGKGPEATTFASLVQAAGYPNLLLSPDPETLAFGKAAGCGVQLLSSRSFPADLVVDDRTGIVLFFHDHDWEPPLLAGALGTNAFYIGAQGSQRARDARLAELRLMGMAEHQLSRLTGPVGLIPSARDPGTLAVSVLAEVLAVAKAPG